MSQGPSRRDHRTRYLNPFDLNPRLGALAGNAPERTKSTRQRQERGQRAIRARHRAQAAALMQRRRGGLHLIAVMSDRVRFAEHVVLAAVGIDSGGHKHVLGLREGAPENPAACKALLADLIERGLPTERTLLLVIEGAKAWRRALSDIFGARVLIPRCRQHKKRNLSEALPERMGNSMRTAMSQACATREPQRARRLLENLARRLEPDYPGAAACRREGFQETLTVMRPDLPESLQRTLLDQSDREPVPPRARDRAPRKALAGRHYDLEVDRRRRARSRAPLPKDRRLSGPAQTGRCLAGSRWCNQSRAPS